MLADSPVVAFLGIGLMGSRQAKRLLDAGHKVIAWNRSREKAEALRSYGADVADSAAEAALAADVLILMLENGQIVGDVLFAQGVADALRPGSIVVDMSSIKPSEAKDHARYLADRDVHHIDAPVSGGTLGAEQGTLAIMAGGDVDVFAKVMPILNIMGRAVHVGPHGAGQLAKLTNQVIVGVTIGAVAEALLLAERGGADPARVREALRGGFAESRILELHGRRMVERDFVTKGRSVTHLKDLENAIDAAEGIGMGTLPYTAITADLFRGLIQNVGDLDHSGLLVELERRNRVAQ